MRDDKEERRRRLQARMPTKSDLIQTHLQQFPKSRSGHFPSDEAATKLIYPALRNITRSWKNPPLTWRMAANQSAIQFGERDLTNEAHLWIGGCAPP
jgi:putative transposase